MKRLLDSIIYWVRLRILKRRLALCAYRRREMERIYEHEILAIEYEEHVTNAALRQLKSDRLHQGLVEVSS